jgi:hypothetical protein
MSALCATPVASVRQLAWLTHRLPAKDFRRLTQALRLTTLHQHRVRAISASAPKDSVSQMPPSTTVVTLEMKTGGISGTTMICTNCVRDARGDDQQVGFRTNNHFMKKSCTVPQLSQSYRSPGWQMALRSSPGRQVQPNGWLAMQSE